jgi:Topoisomerase DNA binding C4 zinc finger
VTVSTPMENSSKMFIPTLPEPRRRSFLGEIIVGLIVTVTSGIVLAYMGIGQPGPSASVTSQPVRVEIKAPLKNPSDAPHCPRCGAVMVKRRNKQGKAFWGCSTFPRCRGTREVERENLKE